MIFQPIFDYPLFEIITVVFCGLVLGSFASALTYRVPRNLPWATKGFGKQAGVEHGLRSACPSCKTALNPRDLVPILSWCISKGRCRYCKTPISIIYPLCEVLTLLGALGVYAVFGLTWFSIPMYLMLPFLVALMMIDFEHLLLPNQLVAIIFVLGACSLGLQIADSFPADVTGLSAVYIGGALFFGAFAWLLGIVMERILKKDALGFGDVKFFAVAGIWLGALSLGYFCFLAGVIGVVLALLWKKYTGEEVFPFGPALILSFYLLLLLHGSHLY